MNCHKLRRKLVGKSRLLKQNLKTVTRNGKEMIKCQLCGNYFPLNEIECHHSIISFSEVRKEYLHNRLDKQSAKFLLQDKDNIQAVCHKCHSKLHKHH